MLLLRAAALRATQVRKGQRLSPWEGHPRGQKLAEFPGPHTGANANSGRPHTGASTDSEPIINARPQEPQSRRARALPAQQLQDMLQKLQDMRQKRNATYERQRRPPAALEAHGGRSARGRSSRCAGPGGQLRGVQLRCSC